MIAQNVVSAFLQDREESGGFTGSGRDMAVVGLMPELMAVMPTDDGAIFAAACNRFLHRLTTMNMSGPLVATVDPDDGAVTMMPG